MTRENDKREYKYLSIVEMDKIKETDLKETFANEYKKRLKLFWNQNRMLGMWY